MIVLLLETHVCHFLGRHAYILYIRMYVDVCAHCVVCDGVFSLSVAPTIYGIVSEYFQIV